MNWTPAELKKLRKMVQLWRKNFYVLAKEHVRNDRGRENYQALQYLHTANACVEKIYWRAKQGNDINCDLYDFATYLKPFFTLL